MLFLCRKYSSINFRSSGTNEYWECTICIGVFIALNGVLIRGEYDQFSPNHCLITPNTTKSLWVFSTLTIVETHFSFIFIVNQTPPPSRSNHLCVNGKGKSEHPSKKNADDRSTPVHCHVSIDVFHPFSGIHFSAHPHRNLDLQLPDINSNSRRSSNGSDTESRQPSGKNSESHHRSAEWGWSFKKTIFLNKLVTAVESSFKKKLICKWHIKTKPAVLTEENIMMRKTVRGIVF